MKNFRLLKLLIVAALVQTPEPAVPFWTRVPSALLETVRMEKQSLENALLHLEKKRESACRQEDENCGWFQSKELEIQTRIEIDKKLEEAAVWLLETGTENQEPNMNDPDSSVFQKVIKNRPSLPEGGVFAHEGFERACPAAQEFELEGESSSLIRPVNGTVSAGTWFYPSGSLHLGMDLAAPMYTDVIAPMDGVILYADAPVSDNCGFLGNWSGWPQGGGNTILMIGQSDGILYAVSLCHLSSRIFVVPGQQVRQYDRLAKSGNSGNSTGPHTHVELFEINVSFEEAVSYFRQTADFSFGNGWNTPKTCSAAACRIRPETHMQ